jgi:hypothetical protein
MQIVQYKLKSVSGHLHQISDCTLCIYGNMLVGDNN